MTRNLLALFLIFSCPYLAQAKVAKVIKLKGEVLEKTKSGVVKKLAKDDWVQEGSVLKSGGGSFAKLLFIDKSQINLGPKSSMEIKSFPKDKAGIINLLKGKVRAKVSKDYLNLDKNKSKLYLQTETAAMGVRGTDFQVIYNRRNRVTNLVTFSGEVAMAAWGRKQFRGKLNRSAIEGFLNAKSAVRVRRGQFSGVKPNTKRPTMPVKISPSQFDSMRKNENGLNQSKNSGAQKVYRSEVPPGVDGQNFVSDGQGMAGKMKATMGEGAAKKVMVEVDKVVKAQKESAPPAEGYFDRNSGTYAPSAGGLVDEKTALYVEPPKGSVYDENQGVYVVPSNMGGFNPDTGEFVAPQGYKLVTSGEYVPVEQSGGRGPASTNSAGGVFAPPPQAIQFGAPGFEMDDFTKEQMIHEFQHDVHNKYNNAPPPIGPGNKTKVRIDFTVQ